MLFPEAEKLWMELCTFNLEMSVGTAMSTFMSTFNSFPTPYLESSISVTGEQVNL